MKRILAVAVVLTVVFLTQAAQASEIGYVDLQKALNFSDAGVKAKKDLKIEAEKLEESLNPKLEELKNLQEEIEQKKAVWNPEHTKSNVEELQAKGAALQKEFMKRGEDLNKKKIDREKKIISEMKDVINEIAGEKGYSYVFESSLGVILYSPDEADMTEEVIARHNKEYKN